MNHQVLAVGGGGTVSGLLLSSFARWARSYSDSSPLLETSAVPASHFVPEVSCDCQPCPEDLITWARVFDFLQQELPKHWLVLALLLGLVFTRIARDCTGLSLTLHFRPLRARATPQPETSRTTKSARLAGYLD